MLNIRLDKNMEKNIDYLAKQAGKTKSEFVRECLAEYIVNYQKPTPWETGEEKFGKYSSHKGNLAQDRKALLQDMLAKKHHG
jgi:metal-responsive CopG/Arc/MetJ family transcriptional regulator